MSYIRSVFIISIALLLTICSGCDILSGDNLQFNAGPILFTSDKSGTIQLYSMNEEGGEVKRLIKNSNRPILEAKWSPDGKKIAFISVKGDSKEYPGFRRVIYVMNADGSERSQVTTRWVSIGGSNSETITYGGAWHLNWSPDSKHLTYSRLIVPEAIGAFDIFQININGKEEKRILNTPRDKHLDYRIMDWANDGGAFWVDILDYSAVDSTGKRFLTRNLGLMDLNGEVLQTWGNQRES